MNPLHIVSLVVGCLGASAAYLAGADPGDALLWHAVSGVTAVLVPVFAMAVPKLGAKS